MIRFTLIAGITLFILGVVAVVIAMTTNALWLVGASMFCLFPMGIFAFGVTVGSFSVNYEIVPKSAPVGGRVMKGTVSRTREPLG